MQLLARSMAQRTCAQDVDTERVLEDVGDQFVRQIG